MIVAFRQQAGARAYRLQDDRGRSLQASRQQMQGLASFRMVWFNRTCRLSDRSRSFGASDQQNQELVSFKIIGIRACGLRNGRSRHL